MNLKKTMMAAVFESVGKVSLKEVEVPKIEKTSDIILEVEACSICGTDVHIMSVPPGYIASPNTILGHELVGKVVQIGEEVTSIKIGDRVVVNPNDYCGVCEFCLANQPNHCKNIKPMGIDYDGGFAEYVKISEKTAHKISSDLPSEIAVFAEPLACVINGAQKIKAQPGDTVLVIGGGPIGQIFIQVMKAAGAKVICSEISELRRDFALKSGADDVINPLEHDLEAFTKKCFPTGADIVIDVVGSQMSEAIKAVKKCGKVLLFGVNTQAHPEITQSQIIFKEITIFGTWLANATFPLAVKMLESGVLNLETLITHTMPLADLEKGLDILRKGEGIELIINLI